MFAKYGHVVIPIYITRTSGKFEHVGSGVLVESIEGHWLFTAAHVLAEMVDGNILLPGSPDFFIPSGKVISSCTLLPEVAHKDHIDLCYISLTSEEALKLQNGGSKFLPTTTETIDPTGWTPYPGLGTVSGYPIKAVDIIGSKANVHMTDLIQMDFASPERLRKAQLNIETTIALIRPRKLWLEGQELRDFELRGMSGGAIWAHNGDQIRLVGIFTEYQSSRSLLIGTRLKPLLAELARRLRVDQKK
jgi:hypothetical protein